MVQSKADREKQKLITDKCQSLIEVLLKDEDNKYCVDCDAKGPRWASWNLGVFLCIRCAGIHRNLGVHISKVKSVNLDAWTPSHVAYVQRMGNSRARAIYEANLPDDFRRPQTDTALESFIRAKYEHRKYIAQDYVDPGPPEPAFNIDDEIKKMKEQKKSRLNNLITVTELPPNLKLNPSPKPQLIEKSEDSVKSTSIEADLLGNSGNNSNSNFSTNILDLDLDFSTPISQAAPQPSPQSSQAALTAPSKETLTKESILSLYSMSSQAPAKPPTGTDPFGLNLWNNN